MKLHGDSVLARERDRDPVRVDVHLHGVDQRFPVDRLPPRRHDRRAEHGDVTIHSGLDHRPGVRAAGRFRVVRVRTVTRTADN